MEFKPLNRRKLHELILKDLFEKRKCEIKIKLNTQHRHHGIDYHYDFFVGAEYLGKDGAIAEHNEPEEDPLRLKIIDVEEFLKEKDVPYSIKKHYYGRENESGEAVIDVKVPKKERALK